MQRGLADIRRLTLKRAVPLVPCCIAVDGNARWKGETQSCGALIPFHPQVACPECSAPQARPHAPQPTAGSLVITQDTAIIDADTGEVVVVYVVAAPDLATALLREMRNVEFDKDVYWNATTTTRLSGMAVTHRTFGFQPPVAIRRRYACSRSQFNGEHPEAMKVLTEFCRVAEHVFRTHAPDVYDQTGQHVVDLIPQAWRIAGTPWTSGIINQAAALPYHRDQGNVKGSWSAMLGARRHMGGGLLHLADYNAYLEVAHGSISIFDGHSVLHGVTPMARTGPDPQRFTTVVYAKREMCKCHPDPAQEVRRAQAEVTKAEDRRAKGFKPSRGGKRKQVSG